MDKRGIPTPRVSADGAGAAFEAVHGRLVIDYERFALDDVETAFARLRDATLGGRAVITFD